MWFHDGRPCSGTWIRDGRRKIEQRITRGIPAANFEMEIRTRRAAGRADTRDEITRGDRVAFVDFVARIVRVERHPISFVLHDDDLPISTQLVAVNDASGT